MAGFTCERADELGALQQLARSGTDIGPALSAALVWRSEADEPPWGTGVLGLRLLKLSPESSGFVERELIRWRISAAWCGWPEAAAELDKHFRARELEDLLYDWGEQHGADDVLALLSEQGVAACYRKVLTRLGSTAVVAEPALWRHQAVATQPGVAVVSGRTLLVHDGSGGLCERHIDVAGLQGARVDALWCDGQAVIGAGSDGLLAVGVNGEWELAQTPALDGLRAIWGSGKRDVWAVTQGGVALHLDGQRWRHAWPEGIEGGTSSQDTPTGHSIQIVTPDTERPLGDVWGSGLGELWLVGDRGLVVHHDGQTWSEGAGTTAALLAVSGRLAVGAEGTILDTTGASAAASGTQSELRGVQDWGDSAVAVGASGTVLLFDGSAWHPVDAGAEADLADLSDVWGSGPDDVHVVGEGQILHFDGEGWAPTWEGRVALNGIWGRGPDEIYAVGDDGTLLAFDGTSWQAPETPVDTHLEAVGAYGEDVAVVGDKGVVLIRGPGGWEDRSILERLVSLESLSSDGSQLIVTTHQGAILRFDGTRWRLEATGQGGRVTAVDGGLAVGRQGLLLAHVGGR